VLLLRLLLLLLLLLLELVQVLVLLVLVLVLVLELLPLLVQPQEQVQVRQRLRPTQDVQRPYQLLQRHLRLRESQQVCQLQVTALQYPPCQLKSRGALRRARSYRPPS
jgi:hypothetical protein